MNIYVSNLSFQIDKATLKDLFLTYGEVSSSRIIIDQMTGKSRGFGFVKMPDEAAARTAIKELDGKIIDRKRLVVNEALPKSRSSRKNFFL